MILIIGKKKDNGFPLFVCSEGRVEIDLDGVETGEGRSRGYIFYPGFPSLKYEHLVFSVDTIIEEEA